MTGEVFKLKFHLVKILGREVRICKESNPKIMRVVNDSINANEIKNTEATVNKVEQAARASR